MIKPILETTNIQSFQNELKTNEIKEIRLATVTSNQPSPQVGTATVFEIILTAIKEDQIIKYKETVGFAPSFHQEELSEMKSALTERIKAVKDEFQRMGITIKEGMWVMPFG